MKFVFKVLAILSCIHLYAESNCMPYEFSKNITTWQEEELFQYINKCTAEQMNRLVFSIGKKSSYAMLHLLVYYRDDLDKAISFLSFFMSIKITESVASERPTIVTLCVKPSKNTKILTGLRKWIPTRLPYTRFAREESKARGDDKNYCV